MSETILSILDRGYALPSLRPVLLMLLAMAAILVPLEHPEQPDVHPPCGNPTARPEPH